MRLDDTERLRGASEPRRAPRSLSVSSSLMVCWFDVVFRFFHYGRIYDPESVCED